MLVRTCTRNRGLQNLSLDPNNLNVYYASRIILLLISMDIFDAPLNSVVINRLLSLEMLNLEVLNLEMLNIEIIELKLIANKFD